MGYAKPEVIVLALADKAIRSSEIKTFAVHLDDQGWLFRKDAAAYEADN